jgi:hypothetical protein
MRTEIKQIETCYNKNSIKGSKNDKYSMSTIRYIEESMKRQGER